MSHLDVATMEKINWGQMDNRALIPLIGLKTAEADNVSIQKAPILQTKNLNLYYGNNHALINIDMDIRRNQITALIGPSGCGKSTFLRTLNRMNDIIKDVRITGEVYFEEQNIYQKDIDPMAVRKNIGMVFQKPNPFPMSIYDNVAYAPRYHKIKKQERT